MLFCEFFLHSFVKRALLLNVFVARLSEHALFFSEHALLLNAFVIRLLKHALLLSERALLLNAFSALFKKVVCNSMTVKL